MAISGRPTGLLPEDWRVKLPAFEGPLDLLLHLVKIDEVEIADISVASICDQFHEYLSLMEELDLDIAGEYIYEAAMLIQLKARMLLPATKDEDGRELDPRRELVDRLLEYRRLKDAAQTLGEIHELRRGVWTRRANDLAQIAGEEGDGVELGDLSLYDLLSAFRGTLDRFARENPPALHLERESYSVREQIVRLLEAVRPGQSFDFGHDLLQRSCRAEAVSSFLALLEMLRLALVQIHQTRRGSLLLVRTDREARREDLEAIRS